MNQEHEPTKLELSKLCKAMGHPTRYRILTMLAEGVCNVNELVDRLGIEQYKVSKHLAILLEAGLVKFDARGRNRCYGLTKPNKIKNILELFQEIGRDRP